MFTKLSQLRYQGKKFFYFGAETAEAQKPATGAEKAQEVSDAFKKETEESIEARLNKDEKNKGVEFNKDLKQLTQKLAEKALPKNEKFTDTDRAKYAEKLATAFDEGLSKIQFVTKDEKTGEQKTITIESGVLMDVMASRTDNPAKRVTIENGNFAFLNAKGEQIDLSKNMDSNDTISAIPALRIDTEPVVIADTKTEKPKEDITDPKKATDIMNQEINNVLGKYEMMKAEDFNALGFKNVLEFKNAVFNELFNRMTKLSPSFKDKAHFVVSDKINGWIITPEPGVNAIDQETNKWAERIFNLKIAELPPAMRAATGEMKTTQAAIDAQTKVKEAATRTRKTYIQGDTTGEAKSGKLDFHGDSKAEIDTKIYDMYPDAKVGDTVNIEHPAGTKPRVAELKSIDADGKQHWEYKDTRGSWDRVKIFGRDKLSFIPGQEAAKTEDPKAPEGLAHAGYVRMTGAESWEAIAHTLINMDVKADGQAYSAGLGSAETPYLHPGTPAFILEQQGYNRNSEEDIKAYAKYLETKNKDEKVYVWIAIPPRNPRLARETARTQVETSKKVAEERSKTAVTNEQQELRALGNRFSEDLLANNEITIFSEKMDKIVSDDKLWHEYWNRGFEGKERVIRGFEKLGITSDTVIEKSLQDAITAGKNDRMNFEDILKYFPVFKDLKGAQSHDVDEFKDEYVFASFCMKAKELGGIDKLTDVQQRFYKKFTKDHEELLKAHPEYLTGEKYQSYRDILEGAALIFDGLQNLTARASIQETKQQIDAREKAQDSAADKMKESERTRIDHEPAQDASPEEKFLQTLFHPKNREDLSSITSREAKTATELRTTEAAVYDTIQHKSAVEAGKLDRGVMLNEINTYIRNALLVYLEAKNKDPNSDETHKLQLRYGITNLSEADIATIDVNQLFERLKFTEAQINQIASGQLTNQASLDNARNLITDGYIFNQDVNRSKVERAATLQPWQSTDQLKQSSDPQVKSMAERAEAADKLNKQLETAKSPQTKEALRDFYTAHPEAIPKTDAELQKNIDGVDATIKSAELFSLSASEIHGNWRVGAAKSFDLGNGWSVNVGGGYNITDGQPFFGVGIVKSVELGKGWEWYASASTGAEPFNPKLFGGVETGFTKVWVGEKWNTKLTPGAVGVGGDLSVNIAEMGLGPYYKAQIGIERNYSNTYKINKAAAMEAKGYSTVDKVQEVTQKAEAIRKLPKIGKLLFEIQQNLGLSDEQLVSFYEVHLKPGLELIAIHETLDESKGDISSLGIGGGLDLTKGLLVAASFVGLGPAGGAAVTLMIFGKVGVATGSEVNFKARETQSGHALLTEVDKHFIEDLQKLYPTVEFKIDGEPFDNDSIVESANFVGVNLDRMISPGGQKPTSKESDTQHVEKDQKFEDLQKEFAKHHMILGKEVIENGKEMYTLKPTEVEDYKMFIDSQMAAKHALIVKDGTIFLAAKENLDGLFIKRHDAIFAGAVDGAVKHTIITISDNPAMSMDTIIASSDFMIYARYDQDKSTTLPAEWTENPIRPTGQDFRQTNMFDYKEAKDEEAEKTAARGGKKFGIISYYLDASTASRETADKQKTAANEKEDSDLTKRALDTQKNFDKTANIDSVIPSPAEFLKRKENSDLYRRLTTAPYNLGISAAELDAKILAICKDGEKALTTDQLIMFKQQLFEASMTDGTNINEAKLIESRLQWAEKYVFPQIFEQGLAKLDPKPESITAEGLASTFVAAIRTEISKGDQSVAIDAGMDICTAVGVGYNGVRRSGAETGTEKDPLNVLKPAYNFALALDNKNFASPEMRAISKIFLNMFNEVPAENDKFLESRLAKKLMFMGNAEKSNPLINMLDEDPAKSKAEFKALLDAHEKGGKVDLNSSPYKEAIASLRNICENVKNAQQGEGIPFNLDGRISRAIYINGYYLIVQTTMLSGVYDKCKNPSMAYNERLIVLKPKVASPSYLSAQIMDAASTSVMSVSAVGSIDTIGLNAIGTVEIDTRETPPPGDRPHIPAKPTTQEPAPGDTGKVQVTTPGLEGIKAPPIVIPNQPQPGGGATPGGGI